jgi:hypothetical protein
MAANTGSAEASARHAGMLLLPLAAIAFPEAMDAGYRRSCRGIAHGGEGPTPAILVRIAAWVLLVVSVAAHHYYCMNVERAGVP